MSGKLFQQGLHKAEPINTKTAVNVQKKIMRNIQKMFPHVLCIGLGSVGKKKQDEYNGDIDIGVMSASIEELNTIIETTFGKETVVSNTFYIVSILYPYTYHKKTKYVSVDFIQVIDLDYTKFRYYCPDYTQNESNYKVGTKIMFANMILNHCAEKNKNIPDGYYGKYDFSPIGLYRYVINKQNFNDYKREFITLDVNTIVTIPFKQNNLGYFNSIETLWDAIHSDAFKYPEEVKAIEINFFINSYRKCWEELVKPEDFNLSSDVLAIIYKRLEEEKQLRAINTLLEQL